MRIRGIKLSEKNMLVIVFLIALFIRFAFVVVYQSTLPGDARSLITDNDTIKYNSMAQAIILHQKMDATELIGPAYPYFLAILYSIFGKDFIIIRLIQALLGSITCILLYGLGKIVFSKRIGILAALLLAFDPFHIYRTCSILTEVLFIFLFTASLFFLCKGFLSKKSYIFIIGMIILSIAGLCRIAAFGIYLFILFWIIINYWSKKSDMFKYLFISLALLILSIFVWKQIISHNYFNTLLDQAKANKGTSYSNPIDRTAVILANEFVFTSSSANLGITNSKFDLWRTKVYESVKNLSASEAKIKITSDFFIFLNNNPMVVGKIIFEKFINFWRIYPNRNEDGKRQSGFSDSKFRLVSLFSYGISLPFFLWGLIITWKQWKRAFILYAIIVFFVGIHLIVASQIRYRLQIVPSFMIFTSLGFCSFVGFIWRRNKNKGYSC